MKAKKLTALLALLLIASLLLVACGTGTDTDTDTDVDAPDTEVDAPDTEVDEPDAEPEPDEPEMEAGPVTFRGTTTTDIPTLDPQLATDTVSIAYIENLFVHLTNYDLETAEVVPEAATDWVVSDDGLTYTFTIRTDIPWVNYNPVTGETIQEVDEEGNPRFVTAHDFVNGIYRACNPDLGAYYSTIIAPQILGCEDTLFAEDPEALTEEDYAAIGVSAPDDGTLVIELAFPAGYFLSMTPMWPLAAIPQWAIDENEDNWIEAGFLVSNGRYVLAEWVHGVRRTLVRNPLMPADMAGGGNVEVIQVSNVPDAVTSYNLWLAGEIETSGIPSEELEAHLETFADETDQIADLAVFYIAFAHDKEPFDNPLVRAAFSAAFDRVPFIEQVRQGQGLPMRHFAPPGIFGAPPIDEVGVGYDPEFAAQALSDAGYPGCEGFPQVTLIGYSGASTLAWIEYAQANWSENLGCSPDLIQIEQLSFGDLLAATTASTPTEDRPHMWTLGWGPDYSDENNWVGDVLWCEGGTRTKRPCTVMDDLIVQAREEPDPDVRIDLYRQIEEGFFGPEGEFPFAPIFLRIAYTARHSWLSRIPALFGGEQWYTWVIDQDAQMSMGG
ncbi:MAG: peptide ABC transporter substrate-binding protein [Anaerolineae bacterium]|nr:peptide ABC transporter substrate-binding protein [Anaerolineae bacterium]